MKHAGTNAEGLKGDTLNWELGNIFWSLTVSCTVHSLDTIEGKYLHRSMFLGILGKTGLQNNNKILEKIVYVR